MDKQLIYDPQLIEDRLLKGKSGIYQIRNIINNHLYIGSAYNLRRRYLTHFTQLRNNKHINPHLQNAYNKYGKDVFIFELLEFCPKDKLLQREQVWLNQFFNKKNCYNIQKTASGGPKSASKGNSNRLGVKHTEETKQKITQSKLGLNKGKDNTNSKLVICLETLKTYWGLREAGRQTGLPYRQISKCCNGHIKTVKGLHWMFLDDFNKLSQQQIELLMKQPNIQGNYKQVICLETKQIYTSANNAYKQTGINFRGIRSCCNHDIIETEGTHWLFYEEYKQMSKEEVNLLMNTHNRLYGNYICRETGVRYKSINQIARDFKICVGILLKKKKKYGVITYKNYHFDQVKPIVNLFFGGKDENR